MQGRERTKEQLYREATRLGVKGRSKMNKGQLKAAVDRHRSGPFTVVFCGVRVETLVSAAVTEFRRERR